MTALEYFRLIAPEFASVGDATVGQWLTIAARLADVSRLDAELGNMALALYAAHMLKLSTTSSSGASGSVRMEKEGDLQRSYSTVKGADTLLGSTSYGLQYLDVTRPAYGLGIMTRVEM
jgi:hypothetical protein